MSLPELIGFLESPKPEVQSIALTSILPYTLNSAGKSSHFRENNFLGSRALKQISLKATDPAVLRNAYIALINLCDDEQIRADIANDSAAVTKYAKMAITTDNPELVQYSSMLLNNLAKEENTIRILEGPLLAAMVLATSKPENVGNSSFDFLTFVFSEVARHKPQAMARLVPYLYSQLPLASANRRKGIAATIKNVLFDAEVHTPLSQDTTLIENIMIALKGPEKLDDEDFALLPPMVKAASSEDKQREPDIDVQKLLVESLILLSSSKDGRDALRAKHTYFIIRELHKTSNDADLLALCENFVNMVMRGEPAEDPDTRIKEVKGDAGGNDEDEIGVTEVV